MARNSACTVYIGNLDENVSKRVLYEILIQVGRVVDLHIPRDKETDRHKGYAFAEYESEEIASYAVRLFSGLVRLHNKTLKFAMSGQDKLAQNGGTPVTPKPNTSSLPRPSSMSNIRDKEVSQGLVVSVDNHRASVRNHSISHGYPQESPVGLVDRNLSNNNYEYSRRRAFGAMLGSVSSPGVRHPIAYPSY